MRQKQKGVAAQIIEAVRNRGKPRSRTNGAHRSDAVIASYNVHKCVGVDKQFNPDRIAHVISEIGADIIAIQEADRRFGERAGLLDLARLERENSLIPVPLAPRLPKSHGWHGNVLLFREGVVRNVHQLNLPGVEPRGALVVDLDLAAGPLRVIAAHLGLLKSSRNQQAEAILEAVEDAESRPTVLIGDLNEWRMGRRSSLHMLKPVFDHTAGVVPSFPSRFPLLALDRVLGSPHNLVSSIEVHDTPLARVASDHLPIKAYINLKDVLGQPVAHEAEPVRDRVSRAI